MWLCKYYLNRFQEEQRTAQEIALRNALKGVGEAESTRLIAQMEDDMAAIQSKLKDQKASQRDAILSKLAARKRMKEEQRREQAVSSELHRITKAQVFLFFNFL